MKTKPVATKSKFNSKLGAKIAAKMKAKIESHKPAKPVEKEDIMSMSDEGEVA